MVEYKLPIGWMHDSVFGWNGKYLPQMAWLWILEHALENGGSLNTTVGVLECAWKWMPENVGSFLFQLQKSLKIKVKLNGYAYSITLLHPEQYAVATGAPETDVDLFGQKVEPAPVDLQSTFDEWWTLYPKGRKGSKSATYAKYEKAIKSGATPDLLLQAVQRYKAAGYDGSRFVLGPMVWLNGRHWEDEDIPPATDTVSETPAGTTLRQAMDRTSPSHDRARVKSWLADGKWLSIHGLPPNREGTQVHPEVLREFGIIPL